MKAGREHRVPLSERVLTILEEAQALADGSQLVFPGTRPGKPLSDMTLSKIMRHLSLDAVPHGFRSSFRDWASELTHTPRDVMEAALPTRCATRPRLLTTEATSSNAGARSWKNGPLTSVMTLGPSCRWCVVANDSVQAHARPGPRWRAARPSVELPPLCDSTANCTPIFHRNAPRPHGTNRPIRAAPHADGPVGLLPRRCRRRRRADGA